jgi:hypothetical protein
MIDPFTAIGTTSAVLDLTIISGKVIRKIYQLSVNSSVSEADKSLGECIVQIDRGLIQLEHQLKREVPIMATKDKNENETQKVPGKGSKRDWFLKTWRREKEKQAINVKTASPDPSNRKNNQGTADITPLIKESRRIGNEIIDLLRKTTVQKRSPGAVIKAAILEVWTEDKKTELRKDLDIVLQQISVHLQIMAR